MKRPADPLNRTTDDWSKYYSEQANDHGGFCPDCGEGMKPLLNNDTDSFGLCPYDGEHPRCENEEHNLRFKEKTPDTFGGYEIYECINNNCDYQEAL